tara:strand:+ start:85 stop:1002 length:918 start_codon:yes stop_codon:yes gene_type:complete
MPNKNKKINRAGKGSPGKAVDFVDNAGNVLPAGMGDQAPNNEFNATVQSPAAIYNPSFSYGGYTNGVSDSQQQFFDDATHHAIGRRNAHGTNLAEGEVSTLGTGQGQVLNTDFRDGKYDVGAFRGGKSLYDGADRSEIDANRERRAEGGANTGGVSFMDSLNFKPKNDNIGAPPPPPPASQSPPPTPVLPSNTKAPEVVKSPGMMNRAGRSTVSGITKNPMTMKGNFKNSSMETAARMFGNMPNPVPSPQQFNSGLRKASAEGKLNGNFKSAVDADTAGSPSKVIPIGAIVKGAQMVKGMIDKNK